MFDILTLFNQPAAAKTTGGIRIEKVDGCLEVRVIIQLTILVEQVVCLRLHLKQVWRRVNRLVIGVVINLNRWVVFVRPGASVGVTVLVVFALKIFLLLILVHSNLCLGEINH